MNGSGYIRDILTPIRQALLAENMNFALIFPVRIRNDWKFELFFFRVMRRYVLHRTYDSELSELSAYGQTGYSVDFKYVGETAMGSGDDVLSIWHEYPFRILHFGIGIRPSEIWLYKAIPSGYPQTGWGYKILPSVGNKRDYIDGYLSPYDEPTVASETILYYKLTVYLGLVNSSGRKVRPSLKFFGAGYDCIPITSREIINRMIVGAIPCRFITVGGLTEFPYAIPGEWKNNSVEVDKKLVESLMLGGGRYG